MSSAADVALIVPVGGAAPAWRRCAASLARLEPPPGELVVVIDGPNAAQEMGAAELGAKVVVLDEQGGPARARNRGVEASRAGILLFIDSDIEVPPDLVAQVAELFPDGPEGEPAAVFGSYDDAPGDPAFVSQYRNLQHHFVHQEGREEASTFWAGCGAVRRGAFEAVGGFDERFAEPSIEDIELGARLRRAGHGIRLVKQLQVKHLKRWTLLGMLRTDLWRRAVPWTRLMLAEGELVNDLNVKTGDRVAVAAAFVALGALATAWVWPPLLGVGGVATCVWIALNRAFLDFLRRRRGIVFAVGALPLYWLYLLICGGGFGIGFAAHLTDSSLGKEIIRHDREKS